MNRHLLRCQLALYRAASTNFTPQSQSLSTSTVVLKGTKPGKDRGQQTGAGPVNVDKKRAEKPSDERVLSTGGISNAANKIKPDDSRDEDDGSLETKEDLSPGTANKQELAKHAKKDHIPPEIAGKVDDTTAAFIHKQSGASSMGSGG